MPQGISFSGLGSGLDTDSIIKQLIAVERRPIQLIQDRQSRLGKQKEIIQEINSNLLSLKGKTERLADSELFSIVKASSAAEAKVSVSATNEAPAGSFSVEVLALAQERRLSSRSFASLSDPLDLSGEIVINGRGIEIGAGDNLVDIRAAINGANAGVSAQILTVADGDNRLILTAEKVGEDGFDIKDASSKDILQALGFTSGDVAVKNSFVNGARSARFLAADQALGSLLNLSSPPSGTVSIGDRSIALDLASDSLDGIAARINAAAPTGVTASVVSSSEGGLTRFQLQIQGTAQFADADGALETLGLIDSGGGLVDGISTGAESDLFNSTTTAVGSLLGLGSPPADTVSIGGQSIALDLASDSLTDIQTRINDSAPAGVTATIISSSDNEGNARFRLRLDGTTDFVDAGNVLESLGIVVGSNSAFESVARVLTSNGALQAKGALLHPVSGGAKSAVLGSDTDAVGALTGSTASGTIAVGGASVSIDLSVDSLEEIAARINAAAPAGVTAGINVVGPASFELQIDGTTQFDDANGVLQALGLVGVPTVLNAGTSFADIAGAGVQDGDTISISGTNHEGAQVAGTFTVTSGSTQVQNLLDTIEQLFGSQVQASVDSAGRIVLQDDQAGSSQLALTLHAANEGGGSLDLGTMTVTTQGIDARSAELQAGQDARFLINGIELSRSSNTVADAVQGVTLELNEVTAGAVAITITRDDTTEVRQQINSFVEEYNSTLDLINQQFVLDPQTQRGGPLSGDATLLNLQSSLRRLVSNPVEGLPEGANALVLFGISFNRSGQLQIDDNRLGEALSTNFEALRRLFISEGSTTDDKIEFISSNRNTTAGTFGVEITRAPEKARLLGGLELAGGLAQDQTLTLSDKASGRSATIELAAGSTLDQIVSRINTGLASDVAEVRRGTIANTRDGTGPIDSSTSFAEIFGAGVQNGDTIRINGTTHGGDNLTGTFTIDEVNARTVGDLLSRVRSLFDGQVSAAVDAEGRIVVTDNQLGASELTLTLVEENEGGGNLNFGSIDVEVEGRLPIDITASNSDGHLLLEHNAFGQRNGFSLAQSLDQLGLAAGDFEGVDAAGSINGEEADGFGRILTGKIGSDSVEGLSLRVALTPDELASTGGERGTVRLVNGVARQLSDALTFITDNFDGTLKSREEAIDDTIKDLDGQITSMERRIERKRLNLVSRFATLEGSLASLQSQGNFLSSQLTGLSPR